jgi:phenylacetate-CoA ligase
MDIFEVTEEFLIGRIAFPLTSHLLNRRKILCRYDELLRTELYQQEQIQNIQLQKLKRLIKYAYDDVPFYTRRFRDIGLKPDDITTLDDIKKIPPLSRQEVIDHRCVMVNRSLLESISIADKSKRSPGEPIPFAPLFRHKLVRNTSSGSTGAPTVFYEDGSQTALNWMHELRLKSWFGIKPGAREARMVRLSTDYFPESRILQLRNRLWNQLILPGVNLTDDHYNVCVERLSVFRPKILWGFTSAIAGLAGYIRRNGIDPLPWGIKLVIGWAAPVYEHERKILEEVFACPVSNIYGAREVGHVAGQCPEGSFHINQEHLLAERYERTGEDDDREEGEILVTNLDISPMPFIRYRMGDLGRFESSTCACGRKLQVMNDFLGRTGEVFRTKDGRMISPNFWCRTFMNVKLSNAISRFQVIYVSDNFMKIKIVKNTNYSEANELILRDHLRKNFPQDMTFAFEYVPKINPLVSGKYQMVVNEIRCSTEE